MTPAGRETMTTPTDSRASTRWQRVSLLRRARSKRMVLVVGASSGMGRWFALRASQAGALLVVTASRKRLPRRLEEQIRAAADRGALGCDEERC